VSRIGKKPVSYPATVTVALEDRRVSVRGPKGELSLDVHPTLTLALDAQARTLAVGRTSDEKFDRAVQGTTRSLLANMVTGVTEGFRKVLEVHGVGYRTRVEGGRLVLQVGFSHPVELEVSVGLTVTAEQVRQPSGVIHVITVSGADKQQVGEFAAEIRRVKPPEPYLAKGIRYRGEQIRRKAGKAFVSGGG
jgi:large subunit ribosomal protein L6